MTEPFWKAWAAKRNVSPVEAVVAETGLPVSVALKMCVIDAQERETRKLTNHPVIKALTNMHRSSVRRVRLKRFEDWRELHDLWIRSGMSRHAPSRDIMWNGITVVWDAKPMRGRDD